MASESGTRTPTGSDPSIGRTVSTAFTVRVRLGSSHRATLATVTGSVRVISDASCCASVSIPHRSGLERHHRFPSLARVRETHDGTQATAGRLVSRAVARGPGGTALWPGPAARSSRTGRRARLADRLRSDSAGPPARPRATASRNKPLPDEGHGHGGLDVPVALTEPSRQLVLADRFRELLARLEQPRQLEVQPGRRSAWTLHRLPPKCERAGHVTAPGQDRRETSPVPVRPPGVAGPCRARAPSRTRSAASSQRPVRLVGLAEHGEDLRAPRSERERLPGLASASGAACRGAAGIGTAPEARQPAPAGVAAMATASSRAAAAADTLPCALENRGERPRAPAPPAARRARAGRVRRPAPSASGRRPEGLDDPDGSPRGTPGR